MAYSFFRFTINNEQTAVDYMAKFLVREIGWTLVDDLADTASDRRVVLSSPGEDSVNNTNTIYIELRGNVNFIFLTTYETYTDSVTFTGQLQNSTYGKIVFNTEMNLICVADLERVVICSYEDTMTQTYSGYAGRISSYYKQSEHGYPNLIKGASATTYDFLYDLALRNMFMINGAGTVDGYYPLKVSGSTDYLAYAGSYRNPSSFMAAIPVYYNNNPSYYEIAGELRGVYYTKGKPFGANDYFILGDKVYINIPNSNSTSYGFIAGPIADVGSILYDNPRQDWDTPLV